MIYFRVVVVVVQIFKVRRHECKIWVLHLGVSGSPLHTVGYRDQWDKTIFLTFSSFRLRPSTPTSYNIDFGLIKIALSCFIISCVISLIIKRQLWVLCHNSWKSSMLEELFTLRTLFYYSHRTNITELVFTSNYDGMLLLRSRSYIQTHPWPCSAIDCLNATPKAAKPSHPTGQAVSPRWQIKGARPRAFETSEGR